MRYNAYNVQYNILSAFKGDLRLRKIHIHPVRGGEFIIRTRAYGGLPSWRPIYSNTRTVYEIGRNCKKKKKLQGLNGSSSRDGGEPGTGLRLEATGQFFLLFFFFLHIGYNILTYNKLNNRYIILNTFIGK